VVHQQVHRADGVAVAAMGIREVIAHLDFAVGEPLAVSAVAHPAHDFIAVNDHAYRPEFVAVRCPAAGKIQVAAPAAEQIGVRCLRRPDADDPVRY